MKLKFVLAVLSLILPSSAYAACTGQFTTGELCANPTGSTAVPTGTTASTLFDFLYGSSAGTVIYRGPSGWTSLTGNASGTKVLSENSSGVPSWASAAGTGTVTSVDLTAPAIFSVSGNPITTSGTIAITSANESANTFWAGPTSGGATTPAFRAIVIGDFPSIGANTVVGNGTGGSAVPTALSVPSCSTANSALTWTSATGFGCNSITTTLAAISADNLLLNATGGSAAPTGQPVGSCSAAQQALTYNTSTHAFGCNTISGSGTVTVGVAGQLAYYGGSTNVVNGNIDANISAGALTLGLASTTIGQLILEGSSSGAVTITPQAAAGTPTVTWGTSSGTPVVTASSPLAITTATGNITVTGAAGKVLAGSGPAFTATPTIGIAATTTGALNFVGTTSGTVTLSVVDAAGTWTLKLPTSAGSNGQFLETDGSGNASWATVAGSGTVDSGTATQLAYYAASTNEVGGNTNATIVSGALTLGQGGSTIGQLKLSGNTSGTTTITPAAVASGTLTLPAVTDTLAGKALANGGTNNALTASNGGIVWSDASKLNILSGTATANQVLLSGSTATPAWSTATYPATTTINQMLYSSSANVIAGLATANGGILNANASGVPAITVTPVIGVAGTSTGKVGLSGVTSGVVTIQPASAAGTYNFNLPITVGSAGQVLTSQGGGSTAMTWTTVSTNISTSSNILSGDVSISSTNTFFDGPSMAQGSSGTWFASGSIVSINTIGAANLYCKLWDGTTTIDSAYIRVLVASQYVSSVSMSGIIASPVGNIRISCEDTGSTTSKIVFNATGLSKDSYIWGMRLQ